jgi:hypothetical protein
MEAMADRGKLARLALERLDATADDEEQWSFLFRTRGSVDFLYCPWSVTEEWEFDGETEGLDLPWSPARMELIRRGEADPNEEELHQWRRAKCRKLAPGSDWCWIAWIVPIRIKRKIAGYALFVSASYSDADVPPMLQGVFDTFEQAKSALTDEGAVAHAS